MKKLFNNTAKSTRLPNYMEVIILYKIKLSSKTPKDLEFRSVSFV